MAETKLVDSVSDTDMIFDIGPETESTKLTVLDALSNIVDQLIVGGGIANTFLAAEGYNVGKSLCEHDLLDEARRLKASSSPVLC